MHNKVVEIVQSNNNLLFGSSLTKSDFQKGFNTDYESKDINFRNYVQEIFTQYEY